MNAVPGAFRQRIAEHNAQCVVAALLSFVGAAVGWGVFALVAVGIGTVVVSIPDGVLAPVPPSVGGIAGAVALALLLWAWVDRVVHRFAPPPERPIVGWHVVVDVVLFPARMTLGILDHLRAVVALTSSGVAEAWELLVTILGMERATLTRLTGSTLRAGTLLRRLTALQLLGWIDLHRHEREWYYAVRHSERDGLRMLANQHRSGREM
jgi:hypothetical protein